MGNNAERELRKQIVKEQKYQNKDLQIIDERLLSKDENGKNDLMALKNRISSIEQYYESELHRERSMHRKFNEQSERVKQTLVDEINKMELQHQSKLNNLEMQIVDLKKQN